MPKTTPLSLVRLRDAETLTASISRSSAVDLGEIRSQTLYLVYRLDVDAGETYEAWTEASFDGTTWWKVTSVDISRTSSGAAGSEIGFAVAAGPMRYFRNAASNAGTGSPVLTLDYVIS